jgi:transglutaminase-like putative cysteine protease
MDLFLALARANGIPAQAVAGYVVPGNGVLHAADYHNWTLFYADGLWRISDPQRRVLAAGDTDYGA